MEWECLDSPPTSCRLVPYLHSLLVSVCLVQRTGVQQWVTPQITLIYWVFTLPLSATPSVSLSPAETAGYSGMLFFNHLSVKLMSIAIHKFWFRLWISWLKFLYWIGASIYLHLHLDGSVLVWGWLSASTMSLGTVLFVPLLLLSFSSFCTGTLIIRLTAICESIAFLGILLLILLLSFFLSFFLIICTTYCISPTSMGIFDCLCFISKIYPISSISYICPISYI